MIRADDDDDKKRHDDDDDDRRDDASAGTRLKKFITDATSALDSLAKRMDALERRHRKDDDDDDDRKDDDDDRHHSKKDDDDDRKDDDDDDRKDDDDDRKDDALPKVKIKSKKDDDLPEGEEPEEAEKVAADKKKKRHDDDDDDDRKDDAKKTPAAFLKHMKKDDDDDDRKDDDDDDRKDAGPVGGPNALKHIRRDSRTDSDVHKRLRRAEEALQDVIKAIPKRRTDDDIHALSDVQARADEVYTALGKRGAPRFLDGEDLMGYRRRIARDLKVHSPEWKEVNLHAITDDSAFEILERRIYADAMSAALAPTTAEPGTLRPITRRSGGHEITEYVGEPRTWMNDFSGLGQAVTGSITVGNQR